MRSVLTTSQAAEIAGVPTEQFRSAMSKERKNGKEYHAPKDLWPDKRTPMWDEEKVTAWAKARKKRKKRKKHDD